VSDERRPPRLAPHRGPLLLVLGILSLVAAPWVLAPIAWILARRDLKEMAAGRMDPAGQGQTRLGLWLSVGGLALWTTSVLCCCGTSATLQLWRGSRYVSAVGSRRITEEEFKRVQFGMTERQVRDLLGTPARRESRPSQQLWYWYEKGGNKTFQVDFTTEGKVQGVGAEWPD
jgi:hypothetical protein